MYNWRISLVGVASAGILTAGLAAPALAQSVSHAGLRSAHSLTGATQGTGGPVGAGALCELPSLPMAGPVDSAVAGMLGAPCATGGTSSGPIAAGLPAAARHAASTARGTARHAASTARGTARDAANEARGTARHAANAARGTVRGATSMLPGLSSVSGAIPGLSSLSGVVPGLSSVISRLPGLGPVISNLPGASAVTGALPGLRNGSGGA